MKTTYAQSVAALLVLISLLSGAPAWAEALDGPLEVRSAYVTLEKGVLQLHARVTYPLGSEIEQSLRDGVALGFELEVIVQRHRRWWLDAEVTELTRRRELTYHAVSERYVVRDPQLGGQNSYETLAAALEHIGTVESWPVLVEPQLSVDRDYEISVRAGVRRGQMPDALRRLVFWSDGWHRRTEWYSWSLPR